MEQFLDALSNVGTGFGYVLVGLALFLLGLEQALFPLGRLMAEQLTDPGFLADVAWPILEDAQWDDYYWVYLFAFAIGFSTTIAEPSLIAVAIKANDVSAGGMDDDGYAFAAGAVAALDAGING